jgi:hypothetical protein
MTSIEVVDYILQLEKGWIMKTLIVLLMLTCSTAFADTKADCVAEDTRVTGLQMVANASAGWAGSRGELAAMLTWNMEGIPLADRVLAQVALQDGDLAYDRGMFEMGMGDEFLGKAQVLVGKGDMEYSKGFMLFMMGDFEGAADAFDAALLFYNTALSHYTVSGNYYNQADGSFASAGTFYNTAIGLASP